MKKLSTRQIRECLGTNKARIQHWGRLMGIEPVYRGSMGRDALYRTRDLFCFLLCQRLFEQIGISVTVSARIVAILRKKLTRAQMERMRSLHLVVSTAKPRASANLIGIVKMTSRNHKHKSKRGYMQVRRRKISTKTKEVAKVEVNLEDLHKKAEIDR